MGNVIARTTMGDEGRRWGPRWMYPVQSQGRAWRVPWLAVTWAVVFGTIVYIHLSASGWDRVAIVTHVFNQMDVRLVDHHPEVGPYLVDERTARLMADVHTVDWRAVSPEGLVALAEERNADCLFVGQIRFTHSPSRLMLKVWVENIPRQVRNLDRRHVFLSGGGTCITVRKNVWHYLGIGPRYYYEYSGGWIS